MTVPVHVGRKVWHDIIIVTPAIRSVADPYLQATSHILRSHQVPEHLLAKERIEHLVGEQHTALTAFLEHSW